MYNINYKRDIIPIINAAGLKISQNVYLKRNVFLKGPSNYVTDLDKLIETCIISGIKEKYPNEFILSEEDVTQTNLSSYWALDPIDGTSNLIHDYKSVCVSLAHIVDNVVVFGIVYCFSSHEIFYAEKGKGAFVKNRRTWKPISVSKNKTIDGSFIGFGCPYDKTKIDFLFSLLKPLLLKCDDLKRVGPASLDLCLVACGRLDAYLELDLEIWDFSAGALILQEAGGIVTDFSGSQLKQTKTNILASNNCMHNALLSVINKNEPDKN